MQHPIKAGVSCAKLIPAPRAAFTLAPPRPPRGAFMRRRESGTGRGARGPVCKAGTRAAPGLPPGSIRSPARSWLTTVWPIQTRPPCHFVRAGKRGTDGESGARCSRNRRSWRAARRPPRAQTRGAIGLRFSARHPLILRRAEGPSRRMGEDSNPRALPRRGDDGARPHPRHVRTLGSWPEGMLDPGIQLSGAAVGESSIGLPGRARQ